jgi:hypothetical protein
MPIPLVLPFFIAFPTLFASCTSFSPSVSVLHVLCNGLSGIIEDKWLRTAFDSRQPSAQPSQRPTSRGRPPVTIIQTVVGDSPIITVTPTRRQTSAAPTSTTPVFSPVSLLTRRCHHPHLLTQTYSPQRITNHPRLSRRSSPLLPPRRPPVYKSSLRVVLLSLVLSCINPPEPLSRHHLPAVVPATLGL